MLGISVSGQHIDSSLNLDNNSKDSVPAPEQQHLIVRRDPGFGPQVPLHVRHEVRVPDQDVMGFPPRGDHVDVDS